MASLSLHQQPTHLYFQKKLYDLHVYKHYDRCILRIFHRIILTKLIFFITFTFCNISSAFEICVYLLNCAAIKFTTFAGPIETVTSIKSPDSFVPPLERKALIWQPFPVWLYNTAGVHKQVTLPI